ncbi:MAG: serine O-acetyltransferase [Parvibaculaceae bacterium]|nr:serine O-acetyltransferase [Parvibaculaceae bacterium]
MSKSVEKMTRVENIARSEKISVCDPVWDRLKAEAAGMAADEPALASYLYVTVLNHKTFEDALSYHLAQKLGNPEIRAMQMREILAQAISAEPAIGDAARADIAAYFDRDPACHSYVQPFLYFKGYHSLQIHRIAHWLWNHGRAPMSLYLQNRMSDLFAVDIHPAARMGRGIFIDHATGIVIGETAVVDDDVSMLHGVTLGGNGKETGDRHPKIRRGVLISAGAKVLGNIEVGEYSRIGAGSVVLIPVPAHCTAVGVPAKIVGCAGCDAPSREMNHVIEGIVFDEGAGI